MNDYSFIKSQYIMSSENLQLFMNYLYQLKLECYKCFKSVRIVKKEKRKIEWIFIHFLNCSKDA
jgi:hypothetical protein